MDTNSTSVVGVRIFNNLFGGHYGNMYQKRDLVFSLAILVPGGYFKKVLIRLELKDVHIKESIIYVNKKIFVGYYKRILIG